MFSYLSRGYGTWEGIAKLETPDSAIGPNRACVLPPIRKDQYHFHDNHFDHDELYRIPQEPIKFPEMPRPDSLHIPKTYSTKSGALLLYSEGCTVPGSRKKKRRPLYKTRQKEKRIQTLKDFMELIIDYKKNGCDPLLLEQLWHRISSGARDVQPGYSPKRYLGHLVETGSLKSFGTADDGFLPSLLPEYGNHLSHKPPPYSTMSLPPVSPSSSMLGSFTFYKHALSTGAASMVSLPSLNSDTVDEQLSVKTAGTFVESLTERLAEVESESGFKRDYDSLNAKEKEDLLTQLLMDVTLHNQGDIITIPTQNMSDSPTVNTDISYLSDSKASKSHAGSLLSDYHSVKTSESSGKTKSFTSDKTTKCFRSEDSLGSGSRPKSVGSSRSSKSAPSRGKSVCSLPPIVRKEHTPDLVARKDVENSSEKTVAGSLSSSGSGLSLVGDQFAIGLNGIDIEIEDDSYYLPIDGVDVGLDKIDPEAKSLRSEKTFSEHSLIEALDVQDAESLHQLTDETRSLKSLGSSHGVVHRTGRIDESLGDGGVLIDVTVDSSLVDGVTHGDEDGIVVGDHGGVTNDGSGNGGSDGDDDGIYGDGYDFSKNEGDGHNIGSDKEERYADGQLESTKPTMPTIDLKPATAELQAPHMSLSSLQDEVRLVATEVLSRPKSGRILAEDAEMATLLLVERMEGLLGPVFTENVRASSAAPKKVRPLGQPRQSEIKEKRRVRSAEARVAARSIVKPDEKPVEPVSSEEQEMHVDVEDDSVSKTDETDISVDDVIVTVDTTEENGIVKDTGAQALHVASATPPSPHPEGELLTVKDLQPEQDVEKKQNVPAAKERKESKAGKVKKGATTKRGSVAKGKKKKTRGRNEQSKTPPFRAGLVPESKPPKGLARKSGRVAKNGNGKQESPDLQETELKAKEPDQTLEVLSPGIPVRVDSETGEVERSVSLPRSDKSPSLTGFKSPPHESKSPPHESKSPISREDMVSTRAETDSIRAGSDSAHAETDSARAQTCSPREKSPSVHGKAPSPYDKSPSPRDKTSSRDKTPSPREQNCCPRDRDAVLRENVNTDVVTESVEPAVREASPEVVLTEKQRRANARAAQRAAAAERRRLDVERKRREREESRRRAQEEEARLEVLRKVAEEEMGRRDEERRTEKEREDRERIRLEAEQNERARQERLMIERQRQAREEWKRKKEQLVAQRKFEEELRQERERVELQIEDERRREYEEKIAHLEEEERERLMEERRIEEERIKREIQEEKERREEERRQMLEERRKMEEELAAAKDRQLARRTFLESLLKDFQNLLLEQSITRAFTFSYFDIMPWFKDRWRDLEEDRPSSKRPPTQLDTVPEETEFEIEQMI